MKYHPPCSRWAEKLALRPEDLSPADYAALEAHLAVCSACAAARKDYDLLIAQLGTVSLPAMEILPFRKVRRASSKEMQEQLRSMLSGMRLQPRHRAAY